MRWLIGNLNPQFGNCRQSPRAQSIDESMVKFKGLNKASISSSIRQRMKDKPIKRKLHVLKQKATRTDSKSIKAWERVKTTLPKLVEVPKRPPSICAFRWKAKGTQSLLTGSFLNILLTDRLHGIVLNAVGTINKSKADQPIVFESDLRKDDFVGKGPRKAVFGTKPKFKLPSHF